jgi:hypothetical protein
VWLEVATCGGWKILQPSRRDAKSSSALIPRAGTNQ